ncbi:ABC transporter substrate-binding protein [Devosia sp. A449]
MAAVLTATLPWAATAQEQNYGETHQLTMGLPVAIENIDPAQAGGMRIDLSIVASIYSSLTEISPEGKVVGAAAKSWHQTDDLTWVFELRDDVRFSDGTPFTAETVKWNQDRLKVQERAGWIVTSMRNVEAVNVLGTYEVEFKLKAPDLNLARRLAGVFHLDPTWAATHNPSVEAMGSGPYKMISYNPETGVELVLNDTYYGAAPEFKNVRFRVVTDEAARINALKAGELDTAALINTQDLQQLEESGNLVVGIVPSARVQIMRFNTLVKPMDDLRVRQAINYAIDKEGITKALFRGQVSPANSQMLSVLHTGYNPDLKAWPYDPEKAKALLAEAGFPNGIDIEMAYGKGTYVGGEQAAQFVVAQLAEVGIRATLSIAPSTVHHKRAASDEQAALSWYGYADTATISADTMSYIATGFLHTRGPLPPAMDEALGRAKAARTVEEEVAAMHEATQAAADDALAVFLWDLPQSYAYSDKVVWPIRADDWTLPRDVKVAQ